ncbi:MAG: CHASE2 domain-containing protein, partial [Spirochaetaceae bacterium]|nr:CHASE2 domain-containing protein [Spirochaetaceae bacterium]
MGKFRILVPLAAAALVCAGSFAGLDGGAAAAIYDAFTGLRTPAEPSRTILVVGIDDEALSEAGSLPWKRGDLAEGMAALTEMDTALVLLDLPLGEISEPDLAPSSNASRLGQSFDAEFSGISDNIVAFYDALRLGSIAPSEASRVLAQVLESIDAGKQKLLGEVLGAETLDEALLGRETQANGRVFFGLESLDPDSGRAAADQGVIVDSALKPVLSATPPFRRIALAAPPSAALARSARGSGFREPESPADGSSLLVPPEGSSAFGAAP